MQFGCAALDDSIHVSAQPVMPSLGTTCATGVLPAFRVLYWYGQVVPTTVVPFLKLSISSEKSDQYLPTQGRCCLSRSTAASNWGCISSYGSVIPRSGLCALRYNAASAM